MCRLTMRTAQSFDQSASHALPVRPQSWRWARCSKRSRRTGRRCTHCASHCPWSVPQPESKYDQGSEGGRLAELTKSDNLWDFLKQVLKKSDLSRETGNRDKHVYFGCICICICRVLHSLENDVVLSLRLLPKKKKKKLNPGAIWCAISLCL